MNPISDEALSRTLSRWTAPEPPPGLIAGVWARVDTRRPSILENPWAFRLAAALTAALWIWIAIAPARQPGTMASESLTVALARAGAER